jgi:hypothetical protein
VLGKLLRHGQDSPDSAKISKHTADDLEDASSVARSSAKTTMSTIVAVQPMVEEHADRMPMWHVGVP